MPTMTMATRARMPTLSCDHFTFCGEAISLLLSVGVLHEFANVRVFGRFQFVLVTLKNQAAFLHYHESSRIRLTRWLNRPIVRIVTEIGYQVPILVAVGDH